MKLTREDCSYLGLCLESFFYGLYSAIFVMYIQYHASKHSADKTTNSLFYALCVLYVLSGATIVIDIASFVSSANLPISNRLWSIATAYDIYVIETTIISFCDFLAQSILIYRCWIVWGRNIYVVIIPLILAFAFLATWLGGSIGALYIVRGQFLTASWGYPMNLTTFVLSITVNALVMGLIVFRIFKVFREVRATSDEQNLGASGGGKLRSIIFVLIESGMALFSIQLARLVTSTLLTDAAYSALEFIVGAHQMFNGITPTIILVRVSMGLSFHDEGSMVEATASLRFAPDHPNPSPERGHISNVSQESGGDSIDIRLSDSDIQNGR